MKSLRTAQIYDLSYVFMYNLTLFSSLKQLLTILILGSHNVYGSIICV